MTAKKQRSLKKKIAEIKAVTRGERDPYLRSLLTHRDFGVELRPDQTVVDVALAGGRDAPDLTVYGTKGGKALEDARPRRRRLRGQEGRSAQARARSTPRRRERRVRAPVRRGRLGEPSGARAGAV